MANRHCRDGEALPCARQMIPIMTYDSTYFRSSLGSIRFTDEILRHNGSTIRSLKAVS
jgi:hypothetical protein